MLHTKIFYFYIMFNVKHYFVYIIAINKPVNQSDSPGDSESEVIPLPAKKKKSVKV